ncbi:hypothetical protein MASR2M70_12850 [Bacillota bacterium]
MEIIIIAVAVIAFLVWGKDGITIGFNFWDEGVRGGYYPEEDMLFQHQMDFMHQQQIQLDQQQQFDDMQQDFMDQLHQQQMHEFSQWATDECTKCGTLFEHGGYDMGQGNSFNDFGCGGMF